jgi:chromosome segregation ATPase
MSKLFAGLMERKPDRKKIVDIDEAAPLVSTAPPSPLEEVFATADQIWKHACLKLEKLEARLERGKATASNVDYSRMLDEIAFQKLQVEEAHKAMRESLTALEAHQYVNSQKWELAEKRQKLEILKKSISACDGEIAELNALEQSIPFRRVGVVGKRQNLWNEFATIQEDIRRSENAHS